MVHGCFFFFRPDRLRNLYFVMMALKFGGWPNHPFQDVSRDWPMVAPLNTGSSYLFTYGLLVHLFFHCTRSRDGRYLGHNSQSVPALLNFSLCVFRQIFGFAGAGWHIVLALSDLLSQCHPFNTER